MVMFSHGDHPSKSKLFTHRTKKEIAVELQQTVNEKVSSQPFRRRACPFSYSYPDLASHLLKSVGLQQRLSYSERVPMLSLHEDNCCSKNTSSKNSAVIACLSWRIMLG